MQKTTDVRIAIFPPTKTSQKYEFRCLADHTNSNDSSLDKLKRDAKFHVKKLIMRVAPKLSSGFYGVSNFGFVASNFEITHLDVWDSIYPLMHLIRGVAEEYKIGKPIIGDRYSKCHIVFLYPVLENVRAFYIKRAADFGLDITIEGPTFNRTYNVTTAGDALAFGGGKDSRLVYGVLMEIGSRPAIYNVNHGCPDIVDAKIAKSTSYGLTNRIMPALMSLSRRVYFGGALGEAFLYNPWQEYYEWSAVAPMKEFSSLMSSLGIEMQFIAPLSILPYNIIQNILFQRYPEIYKYQQSVSPQERSAKNLHVSLCKLYHQIDFSEHCSLELFKELLKKFVVEQISNPEDFGYRNEREVIVKEERSIIYRLRDHPLLNEVKDSIPKSWDGEQIDYIHTYVYPGIDANILNIFSKYAKDIEESLPAGDWRIPGY
jgi:hypothetical protein